MKVKKKGRSYKTTEKTRVASERAQRGEQSQELEHREKYQKEMFEKERWVPLLSSFTDRIGVSCGG